MNAHRLNTLLQYIANEEIAPWNPITDVDTDCDDIGTISKDDQAALYAFYQKFTTIDVLADDVAAVVLANEAPTVLATVDEASIVFAAVDETSIVLAADNATADEATAGDADTILAKAAVVTDNAANASAAAKQHRKKKLPDLFHDAVQVNEPRQNGDARHIFAQYTAHTLQTNGEEYKTEHKSVTFHFKKYKNIKKRPKTATYDASDSTIHNYGMAYKPGCPCNFTRVARFILEHPNHLFKNGTPIPEKLTILYYDN